MKKFLELLFGGKFIHTLVNAIKDIIVAYIKKDEKSYVFFQNPTEITEKDEPNINHSKKFFSDESIKKSENKKTNYEINGSIRYSSIPSLEELENMDSDSDFAEGFQKFLEARNKGE